VESVESVENPGSVFGLNGSLLICAICGHLARSHSISAICGTCTPTDPRATPQSTPHRRIEILKTLRLCAVA